MLEEFFCPLPTAQRATRRNEPEIGHYSGSAGGTLAFAFRTNKFQLIGMPPADTRRWLGGILVASGKRAGLLPVLWLVVTAIATTIWYSTKKKIFYAMLSHQE